MTNALSLAVSNPVSSGLTVRQTVLIGPVTAGLPSLLPATSASLSITAQGVAQATPLVVTAGSGFGSYGAVDYRLAITTNPIWSGLTASTTLFLYVNAQTGTTGFTSLVPIYQFGGTISTVSGQFTYDYMAHQGWLGNGTIAIAAPFVFVGEVVTSSTAVTNSVTYAYQGFFETSWVQTLPLGGTSTPLTHNIGVNPRIKKILIECTSPDNGYIIGDQIDTNSGLGGYNGTYQGSIQIASNRLTLSVISGNGTGWWIMNKNSFTYAGLTVANWKYKLITSRYTAGL